MQPYGRSSKSRCYSRSRFFSQTIFDNRYGQSVSIYLETDVESCTRVHILRVAILLAGVDVHLIIHRDRGQILVRKAVRLEGRDQEQEYAE